MWLWYSMFCTNVSTVCRLHHVMVGLICGLQKFKLHRGKNPVWWCFCRRQTFKDTSEVGKKLCKWSTRGGGGGLPPLMRGLWHYFNINVITERCQHQQQPRCVSVRVQLQQDVWDLFQKKVIDDWLMLINRACVSFCASQRRYFIKYQINVNLL